MQTRENGKYGGTMRLKTDRVAQAFVLLAAMALLTIVAVGASAQDIKTAYAKFVLPNGLTAIAHEDHNAPILALTPRHPLAPKNTNPANTGLAPLPQHFSFTG